MFACTKVPKLQLFIILIRTCQNKTIMEINWVTTNVWPINWSARTWLPDIPYFHILIPTSWYDKIWIILVKFYTENSVTVSWLSCTTTLKVHNLLSSLFIVNSNRPRLSRCTELGSIIVVIAGKELISSSWMDSVQQFTWSCVPMLKSSISIYRNNNIFGHSHTLRWSPSDLSSWHCFFHICVESIWLLTCERIINPNTSITASLSNVLVIWFISDAEGLCIERA